VVVCAGRRPARKKSPTEQVERDTERSLSGAGEEATPLQGKRRKFEKNLSNSTVGSSTGVRFVAVSSVAKIHTALHETFLDF